MDFKIEFMQPEDWPKVKAIYAEGLSTGLAAFRNAPPKWEVWDAEHLPHSRLVARDGSGILGWAALAAVSST